MWDDVLSSTIAAALASASASALGTALADAIARADTARMRDLMYCILLCRSNRSEACKTFLFLRGLLSSDEIEKVTR